MSTTIETGVYRNAATGHTIVVNGDHPKGIGVPPGYTHIASEEEFATGRFHPSAMPGHEPEGWTPETASHGIGNEPQAAAGGVSEDDVQKIVAAAVKKATEAERKKSDAEIDAKVAAALEAATTK